MYNNKKKSSFLSVVLAISTDIFLSEYIILFEEGAAITS
jgi:hypothetical protein